MYVPSRNRIFLFFYFVTVYMNSCITGHTSTEESSTITEEQVCVPRVPPLPVAKRDDPLNSEVCLVK